MFPDFRAAEQEYFEKARKLMGDDYWPYGVSVYWDKPSGDKIYLPLGGGIQREFCIGSQKLAASLQLFQYVLRPSKGSEHDLSFMLEIDL